MLSGIRESKDDLDHRSRLFESVLFFRSSSVLKTDAPLFHGLHTPLVPLFHAGPRSLR